MISQYGEGEQRLQERKRRKGGKLVGGVAKVVALHPGKLLVFKLDPLVLGVDRRMPASADAPARQTEVTVL